MPSFLLSAYFPLQFLWSGGQFLPVTVCFSLRNRQLPVPSQKPYHPNFSAPASICCILFPDHEVILQFDEYFPLHNCSFAGTKKLLSGFEKFSLVTPLVFHVLHPIWQIKVLPALLPAPLSASTIPNHCRFLKENLQLMPSGFQFLFHHWQ